MIASGNSIRPMRSYKTYNRYINFVKFFYSISYKSDFINLDQCVNWLKNSLSITTIGCSRSIPMLMVIS